MELPPISSNSTTSTAEQLADTPKIPIPEPRLTGTPRPDVAGADAPPGDEPQVDVANADESERLPSGGPLAIATAEPVSQDPVQIGDWTYVGDESGLPTAFTSNLNGQTGDVIRKLTILCTTDGSVEYQIDAVKQFTGFRVYADQLSYRAVTAHANTVTGADAETMTTTLGRGYDWAQMVPDAGRRLTLRANDAAGTLALFSAGGYAEAQQRVMDACTPRPDTAAASTEPVPEEPAAAPAEDTADVPAEPPAEQPEQTAETVRKPQVAPVPAPRIQRPVQQDDAPLDLLSGG